jgi:ribulose-phosphate 3-epimerase
VGVAINPGTPVSAVEEVLQHLDLVLPMSVNPGFGGQTFIPETLDKVRRLRQMVRERGYSTQIEVDGGIKADWTAEESVKAGATILVAGTAIFNDNEPVGQCMAGMRSCVQGLRERY